MRCDPFLDNNGGVALSGLGVDWGNLIAPGAGEIFNSIFGGKKKSYYPTTMPQPLYGPPAPTVGNGITLGQTLPGWVQTAGGVLQQVLPAIFGQQQQPAPGPTSSPAMVAPTFVYGPPAPTAPQTSGVSPLVVIGGLALLAYALK